MLETKADSDSLEDLASSVNKHILCLHAHTQAWEAEMNRLDDDREGLQLVLSIRLIPKISEEETVSQRLKDTTAVIYN